MAVGTLFFDSFILEKYTCSTSLIAICITIKLYVLPSVDENKFCHISRVHENSCLIPCITVLEHEHILHRTLMETPAT